MKNILLLLLILLAVTVHFKNGETVIFSWATLYLSAWDEYKVCERNYTFLDGYGKTVTIPKSAVLYIELQKEES